MLAIPSPDLLVNLFASGAQVLGLATVAFGGIFASRRRNAGAADARPAASRWPFLVTLGLLIAVSVAFTLHVLATNDAHNRRLQTNLLRKSVEGGKKVGDTSLKTLSFSAQHQHPRALASETIAT